MTFKFGEVVTGILFTLVAGWFLLEAIQLPAPLNNHGGVGPSTFPAGISTLIIIFSIILIFGGIRKGAKEKMKIVIKRHNSILASMLLIVLYAISFHYIGYYVATALFMPVALLLASELRWKMIIFVTVLFELFAFCVFAVLLSVPLP